MNIFIIILFSYLVGSISGSMVLGKLKGVDIRTMGSRNAGGTNAFRTIGPLFALGVVIIDILKGYISVIFISDLSFFINNPVIIHEYKQVVCGIAAVLGHVYPIYYKFKGGKGAGTLIGIVGALFPEAMLNSLVSWIISLIFTGYVGFSTMFAGIVLTITVFFIPNIPSIYFYFSLLMAIFIIFTHRSNVVRMIEGNENRFEKIMLFKNLFKK